MFQSEEERKFVNTLDYVKRRKEKYKKYGDSYLDKRRQKTSLNQIKFRNLLDLHGINDISEYDWNIHNLDILLHSVYSNNISMTKLLLDNGAKIYRRDSGRWYWTYLHHACDNGNIDMIKLLIDYGADLHAKDQYDRTPLDCLHRRYNEYESLKIFECIKFLNNAIIDQENKKSN